MPSRDFSLIPFPTEPSPPGVAIGGRIDRVGNLLQFACTIVGISPKIVIPAASESPRRQFALWEATCWEFFLAAADDEGYWEFNLSPNGDWNIYRLDGYRQGLREEARISQLPFQVTRGKDSISLLLELDLTPLLSSETSFAKRCHRQIVASVTTVIQSLGDTSAKEYSYWAISHTGAEADFHRRDSFCLVLS
jgi:hypothetical protein